MAMFEVFTKHEEQRVGVFVDVQNLYYSARNIYNARVNFSALLKESVGSRKLIRALAYVIRAQMPEEQKELEGLAVKRGPKAVYGWIYGESSHMVDAAPGSWEEVGVTDPLEGLKQLLDGIRQMQGLKS